MQNNDKKQSIISLQNISKSFYENGKKVDILDNVDLEILEGEKVAIVGPSGSGKSTILSILSGLDTPDNGDVTVLGKEINKLSEKELSIYRNKDIGIIFQSFELILPFSVYENVAVPQDIAKVKNQSKIDELLKAVNLKSKINSSVINLSGGEKQRTAIARALSNNPKIILADEPTGSLDRVTGNKVLEILNDLVAKENKTLVLITHDEEIAKKMDKVYMLKNKKLELYEYK